ncbi:MAG: hypothetical protein RLZZ292_3134 [Bacteroidota bacterium]|jgi:hypothetical protein
MAFTSFKNISEIVTKYKLYYDVQSFIPMVVEKQRFPSAHLLETLSFNLQETVYDISEAALCESIIYPVLQDVWKAYLKELFLWSHTGIEADSDLTGIPDYLIAQKSIHGRVLGLPLLTTVEAKKDNFAEGWVQCTAQLLAMQALNKEKGDYTLYGIVTNGEQWEFARLENSTLTRNSIAFSIFDLHPLYTAVDFVFKRCCEQVKE